MLNSDSNYWDPFCYDHHSLGVNCGNLSLCGTMMISWVLRCQKRILPLEYLTDLLIWKGQYSAGLWPLSFATEMSSLWTKISIQYFIILFFINYDQCSSDSSSNKYAPVFLLKSGVEGYIQTQSMFPGSAVSRKLLLWSWKVPSRFGSQKLDGFPLEETSAGSDWRSCLVWLRQLSRICAVATL